MIRQPPKSPRTDTLFPYTTLFRSDMVAVSAEVSGPIAEVAVDENEPVATGDVLFRIDAEPFRVALAHAEAALALARADIVSLKAAYRQKSEALQLAQTAAAFAEREFGRPPGPPDTPGGPHAGPDAPRASPAPALHPPPA